VTDWVDPTPDTSGPNVPWTEALTTVGYPTDLALPDGAVTPAPVEDIPEGSYYYSLADFAAKTEADWINPIGEMESQRWSAFGMLLGYILDSLLGLPRGTTGMATAASIYTALSSLRNQSEEAYNSAIDAAAAAASANFMVDWKAAAGSNLIPSPQFTNPTVSRFVVYSEQYAGYTVRDAEHSNEQAHSGDRAWTWHHVNGHECGFIMAPTTRVAHFDVRPDDVYEMSAWVFPRDTNAVAHGSIRIGGTLTDISGGLDDLELYLDVPQNGPNMVRSQWNKISYELTIPAGYDQAQFWVKSTDDVATNNVWWLDDVVLRETTAAVGARAQADLAEWLVTAKARAGSNLVLDPKFLWGAVAGERFPVNPSQVCGYSTAEHNSGVTSWTWTQKAAAACGLVLNPTSKVDTFQVTTGEVYAIETFIQPATGNTGTTGAVRLGATFSDSAGVHTDTDVYGEVALTSVPKGSWKQLDAVITVPLGFDTAQFWVMTTSETPTNSIFYVDDIVLRETTDAAKVRAQADLADVITGVRAASGACLVIDPKFTNQLVTRYPYAPSQVCDYTNAEHHSGLTSWTWTQLAGSPCGFIFNPTANYDGFQVNDGEVYTSSAWLWTDATTGAVRIGATFTDTSGELSPTEVYTETDLSTVSAGDWHQFKTTTTCPNGYDVARFWVITTADTPTDSVVYVDDVNLRETAESVRAQSQADWADAITGMRAIAGVNLVIDPKLTNRLVPRFRYGASTATILDYTNDEHHSGVLSWSWTQTAATVCGFVFNPTESVHSFQVSPGDTFIASAWIHPKSTNTATGDVRIGASFTDSSGVLSSTDTHVEYSLATEVPVGQWTPVSAPVVVPAGYDTAEFWVIATSSTPADSVFYVDDVSVKDTTAAVASEAAANLANFVVTMKAKAGSNLILDPTFSNVLVDRFPYNTNETHAYSADQHHSGVTSWSWTQASSIACGLVFNPTVDVGTFQVNRDDNYVIGCWIHPKSTNTATGTIRIGATLTDSSGGFSATDVYTEYSLATEVPVGEWTSLRSVVVIPAGYDTAQFWVIATSATPTGGVFYVDDASLRDTTTVAATTLEANLANFVVGMKAKAGSNLMAGPTFSSTLVDRFPVDVNQVCGYASGAGEQKHSGLQSWKWTHRTTVPSGLFLAPTQTVDSFEVKASESFFVEAYIYPKSTNTTTTGSIRLGATFSDSAGVQSDTDLYADYPLNGPDVPTGEWSKLNTTIAVPDGFDTVKFWVMATSTAPIGSIWWVDDVTIRESTDSAKAQAQADYANFVTNLKSQAGVNLVIDPKFGMGSLIDRFPYNTSQVYDYSTTQHHSGLVSWKWTQKASAACGFVMAPTATVDTFQVKEGERWFVEAWIHPASSNSGTAGAIRVGATFTDSAGYLSPTDVYTEVAMSAVTKGAWNQVSKVVDSPTGYDTAKFWIITTSATATSTVFYVDDVTVKAYENSAAASAAAAAADAHATTALDTLAGITAPGNKVLSPNFESTTLVRLPVGSPTLAYSTEQHALGARSLKVTTTAASQGVYLAPTQSVSAFTVQPGDMFNCGAKVRLSSSSSSSGSTNIVMRWLNDGATISDVVGTTIVNSDSTLRSSWVDFTVSGTAPANCDGLQVFVATNSSAATGAIFYVDAAYVREKTLVQTVIDNIHQAVQGGSSTGNTLTSVFDNIKSVVDDAVDTANTLEAVSAAGNMVISPNFELTFIDRIPYGSPTGDYSTEQAALGTHSWKFTTTAASTQGIYLAPTQTNQTFTVQPGDTYTASAKVRPYTASSGTGYVYIAMRWYNNGASLGGASGGTSINNDVFSGWQDFTITGIAPATADQMQVYIVANSSTPTGRSYYVDAAQVREQSVLQKVIDNIHQAINGGSTTTNTVASVLDNLKVAWSNFWDGLNGSSGASGKLPSDVKTVASAVKSTSDTASTNATTAIGSASTANTTANTATTNLQTVVDGTVQAVDGGSATGAAASTFKTKLQLAWANLWDGLNGTTGATTKLPSDVKTVAAAVKSTAGTALTNAATADGKAVTADGKAVTADGKAVTADGKAVTAQTNLQTVVDSTVQAVDGGSATGAAHATVKDKLQLAWSKIFDGLNGTTGSTTKLPADAYTAAAAVKSNAALGVTNAATADGKAVAINTTLFNQSTPGSAILTTVVPNLSATKITSGTVDVARLPSTLTTVGSGFIMRKTTGAIDLSCSANTPTGIPFATSSYDSTASNTGDYTLSTGAGGELKVSAANAGWYMVEVAFGIAQTARAVGYRIAAAMYLNGSLHKIGSTVDYFGTFDTQIPFSCQASFIVYLAANDYVTPGCMLYSQSTISSSLASGTDVIAPNFNRDTYFSVSLLNRSLA
jgi:hypothetical protein